MSEATKRPRWVIFLLVLLPAWLFLSAGGALWYYFHNEKKKSLVERERFAQAVSVPLLSDDLSKIIEVIGERNSSSDSSGANLSRMASMIDGLLGPSNTGYSIQKTTGPSKWPLIQVTLSGADPKAAPIWVISSYDSRVGSRGAEANATGLAATLATAQALARDKPKSAIHFVFLPHANDLTSPVTATANTLKELIVRSNPPKALLCVEAMGAGEALWLSSGDANALPLTVISGLGSVYGSEAVYLGDGSDLASILLKMNLPAVRVATCPRISPDAKDEGLPFPPTVAASTGRLVELIRRCSSR